MLLGCVRLDAYKRDSMQIERCTAVPAPWPRVAAPLAPQAKVGLRRCLVARSHTWASDVHGWPGTQGAACPFGLYAWAAARCAGVALVIAGSAGSRLLLRLLLGGNVDS